MMKRYFIHNPIFRLLSPAIYGVLVYLLILLINNNVSQVNELFTTQEVYVCIMLSYLVFECIRLIIVVLDRFLTERYQNIRFALQLVVTTVASVVLVVGCLSLYFKYALGFSISGTQLLLFVLIFIVTALLYNILYFSNYYLQKENTLKLNTEKQQRLVLEMEMMEFKNDLNPDLLYESLENLIALMYRDVEQAEEYIDCLASTYRYVLTNRQQELVPLSMELDAARHLLKLLNEKYNGQLKFESSFTQRELESMLIPGSLPMIIESIVRNTIITRFEPFVISCYREDEYITVQSRLNDKLILHPSSDHAISRLQRSYSLYSDLPLIKVKAYAENYVKLPVINVVEETGIIQ